MIRKTFLLLAILGIIGLANYAMATCMPSDNPPTDESQTTGPFGEDCENTPAGGSTMMTNFAANDKKGGQIKGIPGSPIGGSGKRGPSGGGGGGVTAIPVQGPHGYAGGNMATKLGNFEEDNKPMQIMATGRGIGPLDVSQKFIFFRRQLFAFPINGDPLFGAKAIYTSIRDNYTANKDGNTMLGPGWALNFEAHLEKHSTYTDDLMYRSPAGDPYWFDNTATDQWKSKYYMTMGAKITKSGSYYTMKFKDGQSEFRFKQNGKLDYIKDRNGNKLTFLYDGSDRLTKVDSTHTSNDIDSRYLSFSYDANSRLTKITMPDSKKVSFSYDGSRRLTAIRDNDGNAIEKYEYDGASYRIKKTYHRSTTSADASVVVAQYMYDSSGDVTKFQDGSDNTLASIVYAGDNSTVTSALGLQQVFENRSKREPGKIRYIVGGQEIKNKKQFFKTDGAGNDRRVDYRYDFSNNTTYYTYDSGYEWAEANVKSINFPGGPSTDKEYFYDTTLNKVTKVTDARGKQTKYYYNTQGNLTKVTNALSESTTSKYDTWGRMTKVTNPATKDTTYKYNSMGQVTKVTDWNSDEAKSYYDSGGNLTRVTDSAGVSTSYIYDDKYRMTKVKDALDKETIYVYGANDSVTKVTDARQNCTYYYYDNYTRLTKVKDDLQNETKNYYDDWGNLTKVTDANSNSTKYYYDAEARLTKEEDAAGNTNTYTYHNGGCGGCGAGGSIASKTDAKSQTLDYEYDKRNQLTRIDYPGTRYVQFWYDYNGNRTKMYDDELNFGNEIFSWSYDDINRVTSHKYPDGNSIDYVFDNLGRRTRLEDPDNNATQYLYDSGTLRLTKVNHPDAWVSYTYDSYGRATRLAYSNSAYAKYTYDGLNRISSIENYDVAANPLSKFTYSYDEISNVTRVDLDNEEMHQWLRKEYKYDDLNQLTSEYKKSDGGNIYYYTYQYGKVGNRTRMVNYDGSQTVTTTNSHNNLNQLTSSSESPGDSYSFLYDANGSLTKKSKGGTTQLTYSYSYDNRMTKVASPSATKASFTYDARGRRIIRKDTSNDERLYYYDSIRVLLEKTKPSGGSWSTDKKYTLAGGAIGNIISCNDSGTKSFYHYDRLGNVMNLTDSNGRALVDNDQEGFGNVMRTQEDFARVEMHSPIAAYDFPEGSGSTTNDRTSNNNDGTISGASWTTRRFSYSLSFNGSNNKVSFSSVPNIEDSFSVAAWVKIDSTSGFHPVVTNFTPGMDVELRGWRFGVNNGKVCLQLYDCWEEPFVALGTTTLSTSKWYLIAATFNAATGVMKVYVNGADDTSGSPSGIYSSGGNFGIGWDGTDHPMTQYYDGKIDSVAVYGTALSSTQVKQLWDSADKSGYHLTTKEYDTDIGLYYFWMRWYDPVVGRFISKDPIIRINRYLYCDNAPIRLIDPTGCGYEECIEALQRCALYSLLTTLACATANAPACSQAMENAGIACAEAFEECTNWLTIQDWIDYYLEHHIEPAIVDIAEDLAQAPGEISGHWTDIFYDIFDWRNWYDFCHQGGPPSSPY